MDANENQDEGFIILPEAWLQSLSEKQDKILSLLEKGGIAKRLHGGLHHRQ